MSILKRLFWIFCLAVTTIQPAFPQHTHMSILDKHRKLDAVSSAERIKTEADALAYIDEFTAMGALREIAPQNFGNFRFQLASTELQALNHQIPWISEDQIATAFNKLVDAYGHSEFHIAANDVHNRRRKLSLLYPHMFGRAKDGHIEAFCRPVEALYVLFLLDYNAQFDDDRAHEPGLSAEQQPSQRALSYRSARLQYAQSHSKSEILALIKDLAVTLGLNLNLNS